MKKSISSRIKITKTGKLIRRQMNQGHFKAKKSGSRIRHKRRDLLVAGVDIKMFKKYIYDKS